MNLANNRASGVDANSARLLVGCLWAGSNSTVAPSAFGSPARSFVVRTLALMVAGLFYCLSGGAYARQATEPAAMLDTSTLEEIVVTGTATSGVKKLDASYNVVSADADLIKVANPKTTADVLKLAPGIWPESSGGQTGANIEIAGFPSGSDAPFFTNMIEGSPMYGMPTLSFMESSSLFRLDDTVERVEIVQGGPGAVFGPGQMGATANFILRRGTEVPHGSIGVTYGDEGLMRVDGFYGGKVSDNWYGSIGGFYRASNGVRSPQFKADEGGQLTTTLSRNLDGGSIVFWVRLLNDKNQFITPVPLIQNSGESFSAYPGFDPLTSSYASRAIQNVSIPNPAGGYERADLSNGRGGKLNYFGGKYDVKNGDWSVIDNFMIDGGQLNTNALFSGPNPRPLGYFIYGCNVLQPAGFCNGRTAIDTNNLDIDSNGFVTPNGNGQGVPVSYNVSANYAAGGGPVPLSQSVISQGWWYIQKRLLNITNELRVSKDIAPGNTLTGGLYLAHYTDDDNWSLGNPMLMTNSPNARPITLSYVNGGNTYNITNSQGFYAFFNSYDIVERGNALNTAFFLSDSWRLDKWLIDASARVENIDVDQHTCNLAPVNLGSQYDLYAVGVQICNGSWDYEHYGRTKPSYTVGANYEIADNMSAYVRANTGVHFPDFDNGIRGAEGNFAPIQTIENIEGGFKFQSTYAYLDMNIYHKEFTGLQYQETDFNGNPLSAISNYGASTTGVNVVGIVTLFRNMNIRVVGDYMDGKYKDYIGCAQYNDINGNQQCIPINGAPLQRQPKFQIRVTPSYKLALSWGDVTGWATYEHIGQRYEDQSGLQPLGAYSMLGAGITANAGEHWEFFAQGSNLTNQIGLTEGNSRVFGVDTGIGGVIVARPIEGREVSIQTKYHF